MIALPPGAGLAKTLVALPLGIGRAIVLVVTDAVGDVWRHDEDAHRSLGLQCLGMKLGVCLWGYRLDLGTPTQGTQTLSSPAFALVLHAGHWFSFMTLIMKSCLW